MSPFGNLDPFCKLFVVGVGCKINRGNKEIVLFLVRGREVTVLDKQFTCLKVPFNLG